MDPVYRAHRIFRPSDLIHGEVLGKGCFGQAIKVIRDDMDIGFRFGGIRIGIANDPSGPGRRLVNSKLCVLSSR